MKGKVRVAHVTRDRGGQKRGGLKSQEGMRHRSRVERGKEEISRRE